MIKLFLVARNLSNFENFEKGKYFDNIIKSKKYYSAEKLFSDDFLN